MYIEVFEWQTMCDISSNDLYLQWNPKKKEKPRKKERTKKSSLGSSLSHVNARKRKEEEKKPKETVVYREKWRSLRIERNQEISQQFDNKLKAEEEEEENKTQSAKTSISKRILCIHICVRRCVCVCFSLSLSISVLLLTHTKEKKMKRVCINEYERRSSQTRILNEQRSIVNIRR